MAPSYQIDSLYRSRALAWPVLWLSPPTSSQVRSPRSCVRIECAGYSVLRYIPPVAAERSYGAATT